MIEYIQGDATHPNGAGPRVICHCCNDVGGWGSGFVLALSARWRLPEAEYRQWASRSASHQVVGLDKAISPEVPFQRGEVVFVEVEPSLWVANIIGQRETIRTNPRPVDYVALEKGLSTVAAFALAKKASIHMPRMGAGLAGGDWEVIQLIVRRTLAQGGLSTTVYDLPGTESGTSLQV